MKISFKFIAALCALGIGLAMPAMAQDKVSNSKLPLELQVILSEYNKQRAEGLTRLYRQSIEALRKTQAPYLRDGKLEESAAIENKIKELEKKITTLAAGKTSPDAGKSPQGQGGTK